MPKTGNAKDFPPKICRLYNPKDLTIDVLIWVNIVEYTRRKETENAYTSRKPSQLVYNKLFVGQFILSVTLQYVLQALITRWLVLKYCISCHFVLFVESAYFTDLIT